jgi:hypothetical protein
VQYGGVAVQCFSDNMNRQVVVLHSCDTVRGGMREYSEYCTAAQDAPGVTIDIAQEGDVVAQPLHHVLVQSALHHADGLVSGGRVRAQLGDHGVVVHGDGGALEHAGVDAHGADVGRAVHGQRLLVRDQGADRGQEASAGEHCKRECVRVTGQ